MYGTIHSNASAQFHKEDLIRHLSGDGSGSESSQIPVSEGLANWHVEFYAQLDEKTYMKSLPRRALICFHTTLHVI
jgi:hypothetical protein